MSAQEIIPYEEDQKVHLVSSVKTAFLICKTTKQMKSREANFQLKCAPPSMEEVLSSSAAGRNSSLPRMAVESDGMLEEYIFLRMDCILNCNDDLEAVSRALFYGSAE